MHRQIPNLITGLRLLLIIPVIIALLFAQSKLAFYLLIIAGCSDGMDGFLARRFGWGSRFGELFDPISDKLFITSLYLTLCFVGLLPVWLTVVVIARDVMIVLGTVLYHFRYRIEQIKPSWISKGNTALQFLLPLFILFSKGFMPMPSWFATVGIYLVFSTTMISGVDYIVCWGKKYFMQTAKEGRDVS